MGARTILTEDIKDLRADTRAVADDLTTIFNDTAGLADERLTAVRKEAEERVSRTLARLDDVEELLAKRVERAIHRSERLVSKHPWEAAAGAALTAGAVGAALWFLLRQR